MPTAAPEKPTKGLIDLSTFDEQRAITLRDAIQAGYLNVNGRRPSLQVVQRWANPKRGCRPIGLAGPAIVLPTVTMGKSRLLMPEWAQAFQRERRAVAVDRARKLMG